MLYKNQRVLVVGLAKSGISAIKALYDEGAFVSVNDAKSECGLKALIEETNSFVVEYILGSHNVDVAKYDFVVVSPGVPLDLPFIEEIKRKNIKIIGEIELAYSLCKGRFLGITGTNGKTTTTALTGEIFKAAKREHFVVGNIGVAAVSKSKEAKSDTVMVTELSSFQLESIYNFKAHVSAVLNITPDHLNRHKTMENYIAAKARIFENQTEEDFLVLNYDNEITRSLGEMARSKVIFFSRKKALSEGVFVENGDIIIHLFGKRERVCSIAEMFIFGEHNVENALAAAAMTYLEGISVEVISRGLQDFKGVEHRIEYCEEYDERIFYNDSKATNVDSTVNAIKAMTRPTVLIAGGMDKGSTYEDMLELFDGKIKALVLFGETKEKIAREARDFGFEKIYIVNDLDEAVKIAFDLSEKGDAILLSPACASWDMYDNFEKRGEHFKACVAKIKNMS